jgi:pimeloyl-ACP methyl ester carboxylesterase
LSRLAHLHPSDLHGLSQLAVDGVIGTTELVEQLHRSIAGLAPPLGQARSEPTRGITGLVYRSIYGVTGLVGSGSHFAFRQIVPRLGRRESSQRREQLLSTLNGVLGDHLEASENPLAIRMSLRREGRALSLQADALRRQIPKPTGRLLIAIHGLCMNDLQWARQTAQGTWCLPSELGHSLAYTPLFLNYNSGRHISSNGRELAALLEQLLAAWPEPVEELVLVGHSMGGLVARSACHYGQLDQHDWTGRLRKVIMLGSPHHGAPLERIGHRVERLLGLSPYSAPFTRLGRIRSAGITDLRHGNLVDEDWQQADSQHTADDCRSRVAHLDHVDHHVVAATTDPHPDSWKSRWLGDGLVPLASALGQHPDPARHLLIPVEHQLIVPETTHLGLLHHPQVHSKIKHWLA